MHVVGRGQAGGIAWDETPLSADTGSSNKAFILPLQLMHRLNASATSNDKLMRMEAVSPDIHSFNCTRCIWVIYAYGWYFFATKCIYARLMEGKLLEVEMALNYGKKSISKAEGFANCSLISARIDSPSNITLPERPWILSLITLRSFKE